MSLLDELTKVKRGFMGIKADTPWPPDPKVKKAWDMIRSYRERYENDRATMINRHGSTAMSVEMRETYIAVPMAREICRMSSSLLFSTTPKVTETGGADEKLVDDIILHTDFGAFCVRGGVLAANEGRVGIRVIMDERLADVPLLTLVPGDQVIWDIKHGGFIVGGVVIATTEVTDDRDRTEWFRMLEEHTPGRIRRVLYSSENREYLGKRVPLNTVPEYEGLADEVATGLDQPTLFPWDNIPGGESDLFGLNDLFNDLNEAETWLLDAARKCIPRLFVDRSLVDEGGRAFIAGIIPVGRGSVAPAFGADPSKMINMHQGRFDAHEYILFVAHIMQMIVTNAGYAPITWGIQGQTANVTREVSGYAMKLAQLRTLLTRASKEHMALQALGWALATAITWQLGEGHVRDHLPVIELGDGLPSDPLDGAQEVLYLKQAMAASTETLVKTINPTWTPEQVEEEVQRIFNEAALMMMAGAPTGTGPVGIKGSVAKIVGGMRSGDAADKAGGGSDNTASGVSD